MKDLIILVADLDTKSASIYRQIAASASFAECTYDSFKKMIAVLKEWFVADDSSG